MPKGMKCPITVSPSGGAVTIEGTTVIDQNIIYALRPAGSLHPWNQKLAPEDDFIFDIRDNESGTLYTMHVREFFQEMERRGYARLLPGRRGLNIITPTNGAELIVAIRYENLETGRTEGFQIPIAGDR